jgi:hypothetical protein
MKNCLLLKTKFLVRVELIPGFILFYRLKKRKQLKLQAAFVCDNIRVQITHQENPGFQLTGYRLF